VPPEEKLLAWLTLALSLSLELLEPDDLLPVGIPADDLARRAVVKQARRALQEGGIEGFVRSVKDQLGDSADNILRELGLGDYVDDAAQKGDNLVNDAVGAICSFSADTLVSTPYGFAAISELAEGQYVLAYDEATGTLIYSPILATWVHEDPLIVHLIIDGELIQTTPEHPFRLANGEWVPAAALEIGSQVQRANGTTGIVAAIEFSHDSQLMYNLTVATAHTYFVGDGQWLVHNTCGLRSLISRDSRLVKEAEAAARSHQRSLDALTEQLGKGNLNPGIGSKRLFGDVFEARARDGARVYFRQVSDDVIEILGKSSKANQQRVINILQELYGP